MWLKLEKLTDRQVSAALGVDPSYIWMIRTGKRDMSDSLKWRFGEVYGFDLAVKLFEEAVTDA